jgi:RNA polymerase sigma factor (sigma-70 family)
MFGLLAGAAAQAPDAELLRRFAAARDEAAFAALVRRHGPMVFGLCRRLLRDAHDAEDAFQATFLVLARKADSVRKAGSVASWLFGVARRVAVRARDQAARRRRRESPAADLLDQFPGGDTMRGEPADILCTAESRAVLDEELCRLPPKYREPLLLCYVAGKTAAEAARQLGSPEGTFRSRLARGRDLMRARLARRGLALPAAALAALAGGGAATAAVPESLLACTARAALAFAAGAPPVAAPGALALAHTTLQSMVMSKIHLGFVLALAVALVAGAATLARQAAEPKAPPAAEKADPKAGAAPEKARTDRHGDSLPPGALARLGTTRFRHEGAVIFTAFLPDGKHLLSAATDGTAKLWELASGKQVRLFGEPSAGYGPPRPYGFQVALTPDGKWLATGDGTDVRLWAVGSGREVTRVKMPTEIATGVALSADGKTLATIARDGEITLWDAATAKEVRHFNTPAGKRPAPYTIVASQVAFAPDGKALVTQITDLRVGTQQTIQVWDAATGKEVRRFAADVKKGDPNFLSPAYSPDGKYLVWSDAEGGIHVSDAATGRVLRELKSGKTAALFGFAPDGKTLVTQGYIDRALATFDLATGKELRRTGPPAKADNRGVPGWLPALAVSADGKQVALALTGQAVIVYDAATGKEVNDIDGHASGVTRAEYSADGQRVTTFGWDRSLRTWEAATGKPAGVIRPSPGDSDLALSPDGKLLAATEQDGTVRLCDAATGKQLRVLDSRGGYVLPSVFSPDGKTLARVGPGIRLYDVASGKLAGTLLEPVPNSVMRPSPEFVFSPDGRLAAGVSSYEAYSVWDLATGRELGRFNLPKDRAVGGAAFSPDGRSLAIDQGDGTVALYEVATGKVRRRYGRAVEGSGAGRVGLHISPDGRQVTRQDGRMVRVWDFFTGEELGKIDGHTGGLTSFAIAPDGRTLTTCGQDTTALVWDLSRVLSGPRPRAAELPERKLAVAWADLAGDSEKAFEALAALTASPDRGVPFLRERLKPAVGPDAKQVEKLIASLDDDSFEARDKAARELKKFGPVVVPALKKVLANKPSLDVKRRIEEVIAEALTVADPEDLRSARAVEVLERMGEPEAYQLLQAIAKGAEGAVATEAAKAALGRLKKPAGK